LNVIEMKQSQRVSGTSDWNDSCSDSKLCLPYFVFASRTFVKRWWEERQVSIV
jgi:hypothetical protein